ncbi:hypothetical protein BJY01DRAFT_242569 [Aspergillus pseudoustus]|uniref:Uncharacterized protein n=1 Tax=Aspergillus pseudoustus TaxID=1810923 RepID=A0ABR4KY38_9EURO
MADSMPTNPSNATITTRAAKDSTEPDPPHLENANPNDSKSSLKLNSKDLPPLPAGDSAFDLNTQLREAEEDLEAEIRQHHQTRADLQKKQLESDSLRKRLLQTANELNQVMRQNQGSSQLTDDELIQKARQLRYEINSFVIQYFDHELKNLKIPHTSYAYFSKYVRGEKGNFETYMRSSTRHALVEAFLWLYLEEEVFGKFRWAPTEASKMLTGMCDFFEPLKSVDSDTIPEAQRKFHTWRSHTSSLVLNTMYLNGRSALAETGRFMKTEVAKIARALEPFSPSSWRDLQDSLVDIISRGLTLDEDISKQVASFTWSMEAPEILPCPFNPESMELEPGRQMTEGLTVRLVTAPGLNKSGNSFGEDFDVVNGLLKMQVSCESPSKEIVGDGSRSSSSLMSRILAAGKS